MIQADYQPAVLAAASVFQAHKENIESIPASVRGLVLINQMKQEDSLTPVSYTHLDVYKRQMPFLKHLGAITVKFPENLPTMQLVWLILRNQLLKWLLKWQHHPREVVS